MLMHCKANSPRCVFIGSQQPMLILICVIALLKLFILTLFMSLDLHVTQGSILSHIHLLLLQKMGISRDF